MRHQKYKFSNFRYSNQICISFNFKEDQFVRKKKLGSGSFGIVSLFKNRKGEKLVVKNPKTLDKESVDEIYNEFKYYPIIYPSQKVFFCLNTLHANIISPITHIPQKIIKTYSFTMPYFPGQTAFNYRPHLTPNHYFHMAQSLEVLHEARISHQDFSTGNVLCNNNPEDPIKLIDFGKTCRFGEPAATTSSPFEDIFYWAPEKCNISEDGTQALPIAHPSQDIFELGMAVGQYTHPYVQQKNRLNRTVMTLMQKAVSTDPAYRPTASEIKNAIIEAHESVLTFPKEDCPDTRPKKIKPAYQKARLKSVLQTPPHYYKSKPTLLKKEYTNIQPKKMKLTYSLTGRQIFGPTRPYSKEKTMPTIRQPIITNNF